MKTHKSIRSRLRYGKDAKLSGHEKTTMINTPKILMEKVRNNG